MIDAEITQEMKQRYRNRNLTLLEEKYNGSYHRMKCQSDEGYLFAISLQNIDKANTKRIAEGTNPFALYNIQRYIDIHTDGAEVVNTTWAGSKKDVVILKCKCGKLFTKKWDNICRSKVVICPDCVKAKGSPKLLDFNMVKSAFREHQLEVLESHYIANNFPMLCKDAEGYLVKMCYSNLGRTPNRFSRKFNEDNFIYNVNHYFKLNKIRCEAIRFLDWKMGDVDVIECRCECGKLFHTTMDSIKHGQYRCTSCSMHISKAEYKMKEWLDEHCIEYIHQYRTHECRLKRELPFDFYFPQLNLMVEIDGEQHAHPVPFGGSWEHAQEVFEHTQRTDAIKEQYCRSKGIRLVRIPTQPFRYNKYKEILSNLFS